MIDVLLEKVNSWTNEKMLAYTNNVPLPDLPDRNKYIQEYVGKGLAIYGNDSLRYYADDGSMISIESRFNEIDYIKLQKIYDSKLMRVVKPISRIVVGKFEIIEVHNEFNEPGVPFFAEVNDDTFGDSYWFDYINAVKSLMDSLAFINSGYPVSPINPHKFIRDKNGLFYNPYVSNFDRISYDASREDFLDVQHKQLGYMSFALESSMLVDNMKLIDWKTIKKNAREIWQR